MTRSRMPKARTPAARTRWTRAVSSHHNGHTETAARRIASRPADSGSSGVSIATPLQVASSSAAAPTSCASSALSTMRHTTVPTADSEPVNCPAARVRTWSRVRVASKTARRARSSLGEQPEPGRAHRQARARACELQTSRRHSDPAQSHDLRQPHLRRGVVLRDRPRGAGRRRDERERRHMACSRLPPGPIVAPALSDCSDDVVYLGLVGGVLYE